MSSETIECSPVEYMNRPPVLYGSLVVQTIENRPDFSEWVVAPEHVVMPTMKDVTSCVKYLLKHDKQSQEDWKVLIDPANPNFYSDAYTKLVQRFSHFKEDPTLDTLKAEHWNELLEKLAIEFDTKVFSQPNEAFEKSLMFDVLKNPGKQMFVDQQVKKSILDKKWNLSIGDVRRIASNIVSVLREEQTTGIDYGCTSYLEENNINPFWSLIGYKKGEPLRDTTIDTLADLWSSHIAGTSNDLQTEMAYHFGDAECEPLFEDGEDDEAERENDPAEEECDPVELYMIDETECVDGETIYDEGPEVPTRRYAPAKK